ncbi:MAG: DUF2997 domain-containing protein [Planctomycetota bacterium]|jgi:hypothetical protein|nr:DUF2997 domain-containing protein [Planctomycetota bacterium]
METHELEIEIGPGGVVRTHVRGLKGPACEQYAVLFQRIFAGKNSVERTAEYYEPPGGVTVDINVGTGR